LTTWCALGEKPDAILGHVASWGDRFPMERQSAAWALEVKADFDVWNCAKNGQFHIVRLCERMDGYSKLPAFHAKSQLKVDDAYSVFEQVEL
jgi:hypothetical protein